MKKTKFEALAYQRVARELQSMSDDVSELYDKYGVDGLMKIPGVGKELSYNNILDANAALETVQDFQVFDYMLCNSLANTGNFH